MYCLVMTTCPNRVEARKIAETVVLEGLAACVQIKEVESFFRWEGKLQCEEEYLLYIKTRDSHYQALKERVVELHSYEVPEIVKLGIEAGLETYLDWIDESLSREIK